MMEDSGGWWRMVEVTSTILHNLLQKSNQNNTKTVLLSDAFLPEPS